MATTAPVELPFYMQGNFAPVSEETTATDLRVTGRIPESLRGLYLRNGPNPPNGDPGHWFVGDGMVHGVRIEDGRASWYRNRWVQTRHLLEDAQFVSEDGGIDHSAAVANTNIVSHAGRIYALVETSFPTEMDAGLGTVGTNDFGGRLETGFTAHPKICPTTGEMHAFGYRFAPPFLTYLRLDARGELVQVEEIPIPAPVMMHDFAITESHVVWMDLPIVFSFDAVAEGRRMPYLWSDEHPARLGLMPRGGRGDQVQWFDIDPCYVFHPMNACERDGRVVLDVARYPELWRGDSGGFDQAKLHRFTLDPASGRASEAPLDDRPLEFPRVDPRREGLPNRYGYAVHEPIGGETQGSALVKYDLEAGGAEIHDFGPGRAPGEGVFVPSGPDADEDDGVVMTFVYDAARDASDLVLLAGSDFAGEPVATIELPARVPFGFHGNWAPEPAEGFARPEGGDRG
ncbi:MAG: carotenoid oxygenase family protein [Myxococcota bacterium]